MTEQNAIPAEKVRELAAKYDGDGSGDPERLLADLLRDLHGLLPTQQPTTCLLGRWAKHEEYGDVVCMWDKPSRFGKMRVAHVSEGKTSGAEHWYAEFDSLTFPHQTTRPEDVPQGEAWRVRHCRDGEFNAVKTSGPFPWRFFNPEIEEHDGFRNNSVTLISPLTPERPRKDDLQAKYDELETKYREAVEKIDKYEQALENLRAVGGTWRVCDDGQPAWRIEHDWRNLRVGEYIIDCDDDDGTVTHNWRGRWDTDGEAYGAPPFRPFIVFSSKDVATPEAIEEAKRARDKETGE